MTPINQYVGWKSMTYFENINFTFFLAWVLALQKAAKVQRINALHHPQGRRYLVTKSLEMKWNDCMNLKFGLFALWHWPLRNDLESGSKWSETPKGQHIVHPSTMYHLFERSTGAAIFIYSSAWITQTWSDVEVLLPVKFLWILFSSLRKEV